MKQSLLVALLLVSAAAGAAPSFTTIDIYLESNEAIAAWQFELRELNRRMKVVGVEGGASAAYARAPYYDRDAVVRGAAERIIVADFSTADVLALPTGRVRIATIHIMLETDKPDFRLSLTSAVSTSGKTLDATISYRIQ